jgi:hypothetical protein
MNHDYVLTFSIRSEEKARTLVELCKGPWQGDEVTSFTWEISNDLNPEQMERQILEDEGDPGRILLPPDSRRIFGSYPAEPAPSLPIPNNGGTLRHSGTISGSLARSSKGRARTNLRKRAPRIGWWAYLL